MVMITVIVFMLFYNQLVNALDYTKYLCRYQYHYTAMTWASAREVCESTNRTLLKIDSSGELTNISSIIMPHVQLIRPDAVTISNILWIGLHQETEPIRLVWDDCEEYIVSSGDWSTIPGTTGGCVVYNITNNQYSIYNCSDTQPYICEDTTDSAVDCYVVLSVDSPDIPPQIGSDSSFDGSTSVEHCANLCYSDQMCAAFQLKDIGGGLFECYRHYYDETGLAITRTPNVINIKNIFVLNDPIPSNTPEISDYFCPQETTSIQPTTTTEDSISSEITTTLVYSSDSTVLSSSQTTTTLSSSIGIITSSYVVSGTTTSDCLCPCTLSLSSSSITNAELQAKIVQIQTELSLDKKDTSSYKRKLISAPDNRVSAQSIGYVGVVILTIVIGLLVIIDIPTLATDTKAFFQRCGNLCRKN